MNSLKRKFIYAIGATALSMGISMTPVQADVVANVVVVNSVNIPCADLEAILISEEGWEAELQTLLQVVAAQQYGAAVVENGGGFTMMCNGSEILRGNTLKSLTVTGTDDTEMKLEPIYIEFLVTSGTTEEEELEVFLQGDSVIVEFTAEGASATLARRRYRARLRFRGNTRRR